MNLRYLYYRRLECREPIGSLERGFRAEVYDPVWFLGKQWQMGEHQGEDASSPVQVVADVEDIPIDPLLGDPRMDPRLVPPEAIVESEPGDWWTPGRRIALGAAYAAAMNLPAVGQPGVDPALLLDRLPYPYNRLNGQGYDGQKLFAADPVHPLFADAPQIEPADLWDPAELAYTTAFGAGGSQLTLDRHDGGRIDWYSVDADTPPPAGPTTARTVIPSRMHYPGAPHPRWWQIENARVDIGGFPPDRGHFATMLLIDLLVSHSDDWFTFPLDATPGTLIRLDSVVVFDSFDEKWEVHPPAGWTLFSVRGLETSSLLLWPTVTAPLSSTLLDEIVLGIDEDANLLWAVEQRIDGVDLPTEGLGAPAGQANPPGTVEGSEPTRYRFQAARGIRKYWHPYTIEPVDGRRRFVQGRLADLSVSPPTLMPEPQARMLYDLANLASNPADQTAPVHQIEPATVPSDGLRLKRQWVLVRQTDGLPRLWIQRERTPLLSPPTSGLHFDVLEQMALPSS